MPGLVLLLPLLLACMAHRPESARLLPLASLPFLVLALLPDQHWQPDWLLLGLQLGTDALNRPLLLLLGVAWSCAAWFLADTTGHTHREQAETAASGSPQSASRAPRLRVFWLLTLSGIGLAFLARDLASFYTGYTVMTLAGYGLVVHEGTTAAHRAGRIYLILGLLGEVAIVSGLFMLASQFGNVSFSALPALLETRPTPLAGWLLLLGFAVKMGMLPLHVWLPLAHPVAPVPASAVLSGVIVKAGLLGWLQAVPTELFGASGGPFWLTLVGLAGAFYAALVALTQQRPKVILAWSTVSQMGLLLCLFAAMLWSPELRPLLLPVLGLWALHHGCNKAALFLAAGQDPRASTTGRILFALPALALAGAPLTGGAVAKAAAKQGLEATGGTAPLVVLITLSSITTSLLLLHLYRCMPSHTGSSSQGTAVHPAWPLLVLAGVLLPWIWAAHAGLAPLASLAPDKLWSAAWPLLAALILLLGWQRLPRRPTVRWPDDDWLALLRRLPRPERPPALRWPTTAALPGLLQLPKAFTRIERLLTAMPVVGSLLVLVIAFIWWAMPAG